MRYYIVSLIVGMRYYIAPHRNTLRLVSPNLNLNLNWPKLIKNRLLVQTHSRHLAFQTRLPIQNGIKIYWLLVVLTDNFNPHDVDSTHDSYRLHSENITVRLFQRNGSRTIVHLRMSSVAECFLGASINVILLYIRFFSVKFSFYRYITNMNYDTPKQEYAITPHRTHRLLLFSRVGWWHSIRFTTPVMFFFPSDLTRMHPEHFRTTDVY